MLSVAVVLMHAQNAGDSSCTGFRKLSMGGSTEGGNAQSDKRAVTDHFMEPGVFEVPSAVGPMMLCVPRATMLGLRLCGRGSLNSAVVLLAF